MPCSRSGRSPRSSTGCAARDRRAPSARSRGGNHVSPASPLLLSSCGGTSRFPHAPSTGHEPEDWLVTDQARLLLVDDRPENLLALEAILEPLEAELVRAGSGEEALRRLLHDEFAAILLDVQMPGMDGFQTAELIKQRERTRHVPILFLTAISKDAEHVFRGYSTGAVDYLMKPFDPLILRAKVAVFIELWQKTIEIRRRDARPRRAGARRGRAGERGALPLARRCRPPDRLDDRCRRHDALLSERALVRATPVTAAGRDAVARRPIRPSRGHRGDGPAVRRCRRRRARSARGRVPALRADGSYRWHLGRSVASATRPGT